MSGTYVEPKDWSGRSYAVKNVVSGTSSLEKELEEESKKLFAYKLKYESQFKKDLYTGSKNKELKSLYFLW